ncbi:Hypothetical protein CpMEX30_1734 [Corynebacterium pseudotuberculosis]|nr:Hypothetical protein CpE19_1667 [Corynebacterium pseudotuberculosis]APQ54743.1 Hypothetical protein CpMEX30_1734 [Corynebacterium pseudotuberculosis]KEX88221.1 hypothetical protein CPTD_01860 [Corynebacterium pseudotuberculosis]
MLSIRIVSFLIPIGFGVMCVSRVEVIARAAFRHPIGLVMRTPSQVQL